MDNSIGSSTDNTLIGTSGNNLLNGKAGNDYLDGGAGSDGLIAGAGDDFLVYDSIDWKIDGGTGFDTLLFNGANQLLDLRGNKIVTNVEQMWLYGDGGHQVWFTAADILRVSDNDRMVIRGDASDIIHPGSGWTFSGVGSDGLGLFTNGSASFKAGLTVQVEGFSNNATITLPSPLAVTEDLNVSCGNLVSSGTISVSDPNANQALMFRNVNPVGETVGALTLTPLATSSFLSHGEFVYTVDNKLQAVQELGSGKSLVDSFSVRSLDGTTKIISFTILGSNDAAQIGDLATNTVTEDSATDTLTLSGTLSITDIDKNEAAFKTTVGNHLDGGGNNLNWGSLTIDANGNYHYSVNNQDSRVQQLGAFNAANASTFHEDSFTVQSLDGTQKTLMFSIHGTDEPVTGTLELNNHSANVHELVVLNNSSFEHIRTGTALFSMPDSSIGHTATVTAQGSDYRGDFTAVFTGQTIDGKEVVAWTYTVNDSALDSLDYSATAAANQTYSIQVQSNDPANPQTLASASVDIHLFGEEEITFGPATFFGTSANDLIIYNPTQSAATGGDGNDEMIGNSNQNTLNGNAGNDAIFGGDGNDLILGGTGENVLFGQGGDDTIRDGGNFTQLFGDDGDDVLNLTSSDSGSSFAWGGAGADTFKTFVSNTNTETVSKWVMDFNHAQGDTIEVAFATSSAATYHIESAVADQNNPFLSEGTHYFQVMYTETPGHDQVLLNIVASTDNPLTLTPAALHYEIS